ncbi:hypothetical protein AURDEDRAFT_114148 [Auricularia subglabra TFB-10046 SS5]|nr:hypothetical protein AURDEDRAFT_114148 [Auricularia subglabra TFB-10046 SS5]
MSAVEEVPRAFSPGKLSKRPPPASVRFASSTRCTTPASRSTASLPHYSLTRSRSRSRARSTSRTRSDESDSDCGDGYETAAETPPMSSSPEPFRGRPTSPARSKTPESSNGPATPIQLHPASPIPLTSVTSTDILHALHTNATSPVPFPYRLQWPEVPPSPPLTPDVFDTPSSDVERPMSGVMPLRVKYEQKEARWKRSTWTHAPATVAPVPRKLSNVVAWTHPSPSFEIPPSPESARVIPRPHAATGRKGGDLPDASPDDPKHEAPARKAHSRSHSEPVNIPTVCLEAPNEIKKSTPEAKHVPRKLHKKKRVSAPPTAATPATGVTPASTLVGATSEKRPKRVSALSLFGAHHPHKDKTSSLLTPPATPTAPQVVVTTPTPPSAADEKTVSPPLEPTQPQHPRRSRFTSLFGVPLNASISLPKAPEAHRRAKSLRKTDGTADEFQRRHLRTAARDVERANLKLWPVANISTLSVPIVPTPRGPDGLGMGWGRASTLSLTLVMGSGSAARTTRRLRKAGGVSRQRDAEPEDTVGSLGGRLARVWSGRRRTQSSCSMERGTPAPQATRDASDSESEYNDAEDLGVDAGAPGVDRDATARSGSAAHDLMLEPNPVFDVVRQLRRQSADGLTSSTASTNSAASSTLLFRPLRTKAGSVRAPSPNPSLALDRAVARTDMTRAWPTND